MSEGGGKSEKSDEEKGQEGRRSMHLRREGKRTAQLGAWLGRCVGSFVGSSVTGAGVGLVGRWVGSCVGFVGAVVGSGVGAVGRGVGTAVGRVGRIVGVAVGSSVPAASSSPFPAPGAWSPRLLDFLDLAPLRLCADDDLSSRSPPARREASPAPAITHDMTASRSSTTSVVRMAVAVAVAGPENI